MAGKPGSAPASPLSSLLAPCNSQPYPILYGQRSYSFASEALDTYIEDFDRSQADPYGSCIHGSVPKEIRLPKHCAKGKHGLESFPSTTSLEFFPSLYGGSQDPDSISLTTEELLAVPPDGSQPFPHPIPSNPRNPRGESLKTSPPQHQLLTLEAIPEAWSRDGISTERGSIPATTEILGSWEEAPSAFDPVACWEAMDAPLAFPKANLIPKFLEDCLKDSYKVHGGHSRPREAQKLLLFQLQAIQASLSQREEVPGGEEPEF
ncbi:lung adenoma susceptibility protein 2 homolog [Melopsittacus undulatus]|uniref:lung adenoma susceptibility protein 2 homolog n=1 Tax=Melopsittacus undulatus TaxID=13146 RepID=UPI00146B3D44|nr:lung adenoma susceptibility protein 2 [Melopsittacus undulatus]